ncbi:DUF4395 domain-containing protein [Actinocorallia sp. API 0066]|uniref:DUF4395 domain-containing protein n=1 Tax=Actinocorallia sp. API 0066 TaxID=2896846 RepID=UPI001E526278|nr:DUF4395 domain-containing protein [Actinocorallia sp. API 0066]MCD0450361.1 DUF4395 domain-containing protein [Actinocorallia sp. API 0066]
MKVDPRGQRFTAALTSIVLVAVLITGSWVLLAAQAVVFAIGVFFGLRHHPYGLVFARLVRPRLGPPGELEDEAPPRFAQGVGLAFALVGVAGYSLGISWLGIAATAFALGAAFLNAAFGFCLGCEMFLLIKRVSPKKKNSEEVL